MRLFGTDFDEKEVNDDSGYVGGFLFDEEDDDEEGEGTTFIS